MFALYLCGDEFDAKQKRRDFDYYEAITVRHSSLSCIQAIVAAEVGHLDLANEYFRQAVFVDLQDLPGNAADGVHLASLADVWLMAVVGFGGMRDHGDTLAFATCLSQGMRRLAFRLMYRGRRLRFDVSPSSVRYELTVGDPLEVLHCSEPIHLEVGSPEVRPSFTP